MCYALRHTKWVYHYTMWRNWCVLCHPWSLGQHYVYNIAKQNMSCDARCYDLTNRLSLKWFVFVLHIVSCIVWSEWPILTPCMYYTMSHMRWDSYCTVGHTQHRMYDALCSTTCAVYDMVATPEQTIFNTVGKTQHSINVMMGNTGHTIYGKIRNAKTLSMTRWV